MLIFQSFLLLLVCAVALAGLARYLNMPYPSLLALGGTALAFLPHAPTFNLDPSLTLALFVAPALLDAAFDTSLRDLKRYWIPVMSLVFIAVGLTIIAVAWLLRYMVPEIPWAAAVAVGAIVAPPDAVAASAVMRRLSVPHRIRVIIEGESLLNDATALLVYRLAVSVTLGATFTGGGGETYTRAGYGFYSACDNSGGDKLKTLLTKKTPAFALPGRLDFVREATDTEA